MSEITAPALEFAFELRVEAGRPLEIGRIAAGVRRIVPILGGRFEGPGIRGRILPGGADWQILHEDGLTELHARYVLETDQGESIYVQNRGLRHGPPDVMAKLNAGELVDSSQIYFRGTPSFETAAARLSWLTRSVFVFVGERYPNDVRMRFYIVR